MDQTIEVTSCDKDSLREKRGINKKALKVG